MCAATSGKIGNKVAPCFNGPNENSRALAKNRIDVQKKRKKIAHVPSVPYLLNGLIISDDLALSGVASIDSLVSVFISVTVPNKLDLNFFVFQ